jgi:hypothetical protein
MTRRVKHTTVTPGARFLVTFHGPGRDASILLQSPDCLTWLNTFDVQLRI